MASPSWKAAVRVQAAETRAKASRVRASDRGARDEPRGGRAFLLAIPGSVPAGDGRIVSDHSPEGSSGGDSGIR